MSFWDIFKQQPQTKIKVTQDEETPADIDSNGFFADYNSAVIDTIKYSGRLGTPAQQDRQLKSILKAEQIHKDEIDKLIIFWEDIWANGGLKFNGVKWHFRIVELYYKAKRYDDAWRILNEFVQILPQYITNTRKWQIRILKREKKDYSHIQQLLDSNR